MNRRKFLISASALVPAVGFQHKMAPLTGPGLALFASASGQEASTTIPQPGTEDVPESKWTEYYKHLKKLPYLRAHLGWKIALIEHSMYMLIDEDRTNPVVGERTLPWGAPDASVYVDRIRRNLAALEAIPGLRLTYDFPGVDLESIARDFPDVMAKMQAMHRKGVYDFVNGTYSLPHLHTLGSESNWRQFEYGLAVFEKYFGKKITLYAFQESNLHQQLPQLLRLFGYRMMSTSAQFPWMMEIIGGTFEIESSHQGTNFIRGEEFVDAQALDGTLLPCYLVHSVPGYNPDSDWMITRALERDFWGPPPVWEYCPDLEEVTQESYDKFSQYFDLVLIEPALEERIKAAPPKAQARVYCYWSYVEGTGAEEYLRTNRKAEESVLLAESVQAMANSAGSSLDRTKELRDVWATILKYQCHDTEWVEPTNLRNKAIRLLTDGIGKSAKIAEELAQTIVKPAQNSVAIFNPVANPRRVLIQTEAKHAPGGGPPFQEFEGRALGMRDLPAGGFTSFPISGPTVPSRAVTLPRVVSSAHYQIALSPEGLIEQITTESGETLLHPGEYKGGELRAMINDEWKNNRAAECVFYEGEVCHILKRSSHIGTLPVVERYFFFRHENLIKVELEFSFNGDTIGHFWLDETKINVYYPTSGSDLSYDVPFGYVPGKAERPLYPINWLYSGGLAYVNRGTLKHWVRDGVVANVLAWGGNSIGNRDELFWDESKYDIRLYGKQTIEYSLIPYDRFDGNEIVHDVTNWTSPVLISKGQGEKSFYQVDAGYAVTATYEKNGRIWARGYRLPSQRESKRKGFEIYDSEIADLA
jgi:hypothetical protein